MPLASCVLSVVEICGRFAVGAIELDIRRMRSRLAQRRSAFRRGFTFIEVAITTAILGLGMSALVTLMASSGSANYAATELTTAMNLANNIHELSERLAFAD